MARYMYIYTCEVTSGNLEMQNACNLAWELWSGLGCAVLGCAGLGWQGGAPSAAGRPGAFTWVHLYAAMFQSAVGLPGSYLAVCSRRLVR